MEGMVLTIDGVKRQLLQGLTPVQVFELYTKRISELQIQEEGRKLLLAEAQDAIQAAWKETRKKAIFARLKAELGVKKPEEK